MPNDRWPETYKKKYFWREGRTVHASGVMNSFLEAIDRKGARKLVRLWDNWEKVVGSEVASLAHPLGRRGRALVLLADDPMISQHLSFLVPELLGRINGFLGEHLFDDVRFELSDGRPPLDRPRPEQSNAPKITPQRPEQLGKVADALPPDSPVGRAYRAYLNMFKNNKETSD